jgi:DNA-binding CsgD family transcriptional regulator
MAEGGGVNAQRLAQAATRLGDTVLDPAIWSEVLEDICAAVDARGAVLLQPDMTGTGDRAIRQAVPFTPSMTGIMQHYFIDGWWKQDTRAKGCITLLSRGHKIISDHDLVAGDLLPAEGGLTLDDRRRDRYLNEFEYRHGAVWWSSIVFDAGASPWVLSFKQSAAQRPFGPDEKRKVEGLRLKLGEAAMLSRIVGRRVLTGIADALGLIEQPALVLGRNGVVLTHNAAADTLFDEDMRISNRKFAVREDAARALQDAAGRICASYAAPHVAGDLVRIPRRWPKRPVIARLFPIPISARTPFLGGSVLVLLSDPDKATRLAPAAVLAQAFGLTPAEARLATLLGQGVPIHDAANSLGIAYETARNQLKAIYAKTETHRQSELVALLARL